jgi:hypothetical protein
MKEEAATYGYTFPYPFDEDQSVAKSYSAICTPDEEVDPDQRPSMGWSIRKPGNALAYFSG